MAACWLKVNSRDASIAFLLRAFLYLFEHFQWQNLIFCESTASFVTRSIRKLLHVPVFSLAPLNFYSLATVLHYVKIMSNPPIDCGFLKFITYDFSNIVFAHLLPPIVTYFALISDPSCSWPLSVNQPLVCLFPF